MLVTKKKCIATKNDKTSFGYKTWLSLPLLKDDWPKCGKNENKYQKREHKYRHYDSKHLMQHFYFVSFYNVNKRTTLGSRLYFLTVQERWEWITLAIWVAHFFCFYFVMKRRKSLMTYVRLQLNLPLPPIRASMVLHFLHQVQ